MFREKDINVYYKGKPYHGEASFINGYNGYESSDDDGLLCALVKDNRGVLSCFTGKQPNVLTNEKGTPIRLKNRRGQTVTIDGTMRVSYEDRMANGYFNNEHTPEDYDMKSYETGMFESKTNKNMKKNTVKLNEAQLKQIVAESVKKVLKENYWGEDVAEQMWHQVLEWRKLGWLSDEDANAIRDIIGA